MKKLMLITITGVAYAVLGLGKSQAAVTNVAMVANISLSGVRQVGNTVASVRLTTRDILTALNATGQFSFGRSAQLLLVSFEDELPVFRVREKIGTNVVTTDISDFLTVSEALEIHATTSYSFQTFGFDDHRGTSFNVSGINTLRRGRIISPGIGPLDRVVNAAAQVYGDGTIGGAKAVLRGTITAGSARAEVDAN